MCRYVMDETKGSMPLMRSIVTIEYVSRADMTVLRKNGDLWRLRQDGQTQVMFDYVQLADEI